MAVTDVTCERAKDPVPVPLKKVKEYCIVKRQHVPL